MINSGYVFGLMVDGQCCIVLCNVLPFCQVYKLSLDWKVSEIVANLERF